jgi:hypothetical protein
MVFKVGTKFVNAEGDIVTILGFDETRYSYKIERTDGSDGIYYMSISNFNTVIFDEYSLVKMGRIKRNLPEWF